MDILEYSKKKILEKYDVTEEEARKLAEDMISEIRAHGGNPNALEETDLVIDVVVKKWVELLRNQKRNKV